MSEKGITIMAHEREKDLAFNWIRNQQNAAAAATRKNKKKKGGLTNTLMFGAVSAVIAEASKPLIDMAMTNIKSRCLYRLNINDEMFVLGRYIVKHFANFPDTMRVDMLDEFEPIEYVKSVYQRGSLPNYMNLLWQDGCPIILKTTRDESITNVDKSTAELITFRNERCIHALRTFVHNVAVEAYQEASKEFTKYAQIAKVEWSDGYDIPHRKLRTWNDVFVPDQIYHQIMDPIFKYVKSREFYVQNNIPNHFGVLLYGQPGQGRTSIAQAIADAIGAKLYVINGDDVGNLPSILNRVIWIDPPAKNVYRVVVIEDIDSGIKNLNRDVVVDDSNSEDGKSIRRNVGLASILNAIDGVGSPSNIIYVLTTNHKELLDPALIRPGRCDVCVELTYVLQSTLIEWLDKYYPGHGYTMDNIPEIRDNITFAELQTQLMMNKSLDDIIKFCEKKRHRRTKKED
jgi:hypothetical protein